MNPIAPANYLLRSLKSLDCEVFVISDVKHSEANLVRAGCVDISRTISEWNLHPDLLLFVEGGEMGIFPVNFLDLKFPKCWWGIDTHNDYIKHLRISRVFDHTFVAQKSFVDELQKDGIKSASWLPLAYPENEAKQEPRKFDVSYVGSMNWDLYPRRGELLSAIQNSQWNSFVGRADPSQMFEIYQQSKVVFNFSPKNDLNMRIFEAMGSGALLSTNKIFNNGLEDLFVEGDDFVSYLDSSDLLAKLNYLLSDPVELNRIAKNGMNKVRLEHTYKHRATTILDTAAFIHTYSHADSGDFALAISSLGFYSDSLSTFFSSLKELNLGRRNRLILKLCRPLMAALVLSAKLIELIVSRVKRLM